MKRDLAAFAQSGPLLRVWGLSGEELASLAREELSDVAALKLHLRQLHGFPVCLQELMHGSTRLEDAMVLDEHLELQLLLKASLAHARPEK